MKPRSSRARHYAIPDPDTTLSDLAHAAAGTSLPLTEGLTGAWTGEVKDGKSTWNWRVDGVETRPERRPYWSKDPDVVWTLEVRRHQWNVAQTDWRITVAAGGEIVARQIHEPLSKKLTNRRSISWASNRTGIPKIDERANALFADIFNAIAEHTPRQVMGLVTSTFTQSDQAFLNQIKVVG
jgi:hypothetical protein